MNTLQEGNAAATAACAKIILTGEHAVVFGQPAIALPMKTLQTEVMIIHAKQRREEQLLSDCPLNPQKLKEAYAALKKAAGIDEEKSVHIRSTIPPGAGLGSSASLCVALTISLLQNKQSDPAEIWKIALEGERIFHGNPSGIDPAVISYEQPLWFTKGKKPTLLKMPQQQPFSLVIADSGERKGTTSQAMQKARMEPALAQAIGAISLQAREALKKGDLTRLGQLMDANQELLRTLAVSTPALDALVHRARKAGALGAKLSGAGCGGIIIALCHPEDAQRLAAALSAAATSVMSVKF